MPLERNRHEWLSLDADLKGGAYEGLIEKTAQEGARGAGQYFTPRALISAIVDVKPATTHQTVDAIANSTARTAFPLRWSFLQQKAQAHSPPLATFVTAGDRTALLLYFLLLTKASQEPWDVSLHSGVWARALGFPQPNAPGARSRLSKTWSRLVERRLVTRHRPSATRTVKRLANQCYGWPTQWHGPGDAEARGDDRSPTLASSQPSRRSRSNRYARPDCSPSGEESGPLPRATALGTTQYCLCGSGFQTAGTPGCRTIATREGRAQVHGRPGRPTPPLRVHRAHHHAPPVKPNRR